MYTNEPVYAEYVRKSRYDRDYDELSIEETLHRHQSILDAYAKKNHLNVVKIYKEVVSGESISQRPEMQQLLEDVSEGLYAGVLVIDIERLSRGNSIDQGIVSQTFKYADTKIITPSKTYDPNNEFDEEYFEFSLFMSRKEYKMINRRLERGRKQSSKEGRFMGSIAPYGYERVKIKGDKGYTLKIVPEEAKYVKLMYDLYLNQGLGTTKIANRLNDLGVPTRSGTLWSMSVVKTILNNCVNAGLIRMSRRKKIKTMVNGKLVIKQTNLKEYPIYQGLHEGIVTKEEWEKVSEISKRNNRANIPLNFDAPLHNYFAGLIFCKKCGGIISRVTADRSEPRMLCRNRKCDCVSVTFSALSESVYKALVAWLKKYKRQMGKQNQSTSITDYSDLIETIDGEITKIKKQLEKCYTFLEQDIYSIEEFQKRKATLDEQLEKYKKQKNNIFNMEEDERQKNKHRESLIPVAENLISSWDKLTPEEKNNLLKQVLRRIEYFREPHTPHTIDIYPNI